jgi:hypothetical protein
MAQNFDIIIIDGDVVIEGLHQDIVYYDAINALYDHAKHFVDPADYRSKYVDDWGYDYDKAVLNYAQDNVEDFIHLLPKICKTEIVIHSNN